MTQFQNLLVGVDLEHGGPLGSSQFSAVVEDTVRTATWLAEAAKASLTFFTAVDFPLDSRYMDMVVDDPHHLPRALAESAGDALAQLVSGAQPKGLPARAEVAMGKGWIEIIRHVVDRKNDLVIVGTRNLHGIERLLLGSTSRRLMRNCPSAVWVVRPDPVPGVSNIMVASDLHTASEKALRAASALASLTGAKIHLVHAIDYPLDRLWFRHIDLRTEKYHRRLQTEARRTLTEQVAKLGAAGAAVEVEVIDGTRGADLAILRYIAAHQIDLLVMGTVGRSGLAGVFIGNTAERLAQQAPCSVLAVKADDFQCPVALGPSA